MNQSTQNNIVSFIWGIADDVLRDVYKRTKYQDIILPMTVIRRLDILLEPTKEAVLAQHFQLDARGVEDESAAPALQAITGYPFYNTSNFTLKSLLDSPSQIAANFEAYLKGFSPNVRDIIKKFGFEKELDKLKDANRIFPLIGKYVSPRINLSPYPVLSETGEVLQDGLNNLGMGEVFEELIRRFNDENNEEAGEHFTPRDVIELMTHLIFEPIAEQIMSGTYLIYDCACGSGGMLTQAERYFKKLAAKHDKQVEVNLFGQEVSAETYAVCKSDMLIKGENPRNIQFGSTIKQDLFPDKRFDFMLANPPYGKSWSADKDYVVESKVRKGENPIKDWRFSMGVPRSNDGQLLFMVNMLRKMKETPMGSRVATVHNGSALFTGDAGGGESNIRQWILEKDYLEAIIALPLNMFYNTGIATYIWVLGNRKTDERKGKVQLIDARELYVKLRKNKGDKNCELSAEDIAQVMALYHDFAESETSKIFETVDFGYHKITVERPLRWAVDVTEAQMAAFVGEQSERLHPLATALQAAVGMGRHDDFNVVERELKATLKQQGVRTKAADLKALWAHFSTVDPTAQPIVKKRQKDGTLEYEPDTALRDTESIPFAETIEAFFAREVLPYVPDAWIDHSKTKVGYEISFTKYFYQYTPLRSLADVTAEIVELEQETEGLLERLVGMEQSKI